MQQDRALGFPNIAGISAQDHSVHMHTSLLRARSFSLYRQSTMPGPAIGTEVTAATRTRRRNQETAKLPTSLTGGAVTLTYPAANGKATVSATARRIHTVAATAITEDKTLGTSLVTTRDSTEIK